MPLRNRGHPLTRLHVADGGFPELAVVSFDAHAAATLHRTRWPNQTSIAGRLHGNRFTLADVGVERPPMSFLCRALDLRAGAPLVLGGYGFGGKTFLAYDLALSVISGAKAFGVFDVTPTQGGRVKLIDYEMGQDLVLRRLRRMAVAKGVNLSALPPDRLVGVSHPALRYSKANPTWTEQALIAEMTGFDLVVIDALHGFNAELKENEAEYRDGLDVLNRASVATGCAVVVIHHAGKASGGDKRLGFRGTAAIFDAAGSGLIVEAPEDRALPIQVTHVKARTSRADTPLSRSPAALVSAVDLPHVAIRTKVEKPQAFRATTLT